MRCGKGTSCKVRMLATMSLTVLLNDSKPQKMLVVMEASLLLPLRYAKLDENRVCPSAARACLLPFPKTAVHHIRRYDIMLRRSRLIQLCTLSPAVAGNGADSTTAGRPLYMAR